MITICTVYSNKEKQTKILRVITLLGAIKEELTLATKLFRIFGALMQCYYKETMMKTSIDLQ